MKRFIQNLLVFFGLLVLGMFGMIVFKYFVIGSQYKYSYVASFYDKIERLESINEPKIILVGNSNLAFGMNSEKLEKSMGMPVVNLGLHNNLGSAFHEQMAKFNINKGDIVVVCHTDYYNDNILDRTLAWVTIDNHLNAMRVLRLKDFTWIAMVYHTYYKKTLELAVTNKGNINEVGSHSRYSFNNYGDIIFRPEEDQLNEEELFLQGSSINHLPPIGEDAIKRLNDFNKYINDRGAYMVIAGYPLIDSKYSNYNESDVNRFQTVLSDNVDCDVVSSFNDYMLPCDYFFDHLFHLTEEGADIRTDLLISDLKKWQEEKQQKN